MKTPFPKLSAPADRALASVGIECIEDLSRLTEEELAALHGMGPNAIGKLKEAMRTAGVDFVNSR